MTPLSSLERARIRRIDAPEADLLALSVYTPALRAVLVFSFATGNSGVGLVETRPHGRAADSFVQKLRKELEGGRITAFEQIDDATLALAIRRGEQQLRLVCDFKQAQIELRRDHETLITFSAGGRPMSAGARVHWPESLEALSAIGPRLLEDRAVGQLQQQRQQLDRALRSAHKRLQRRLIALDGDIARAEQAAELRARANLLVPLERRVKRGQASVDVIDYTLDPPASVQIALDPARTLKEQIEGWFKQARRFERGAELARERSLATRRDADALEQLRTRTLAADAAALEELSGAARALGVRGVSAAAAAPPAHSIGTRGRRKPFREFYADRQRTILVGKTAEDNDVLTREHARPQDLWLHARDVAGAHVVVPLERNEVCPEELLLDAAHLAAHFSAARGEMQVDVSYVSKRYVRKARGAPAGQVQLEREKVIALRFEPSRLSRLLASERAD